MSEELKERIHDLLKINVEHQNINAELRKDVKYLRDRSQFYEEINKDPNYNNYPERGPNDLEARIEDLLRINVEHHNLNAELRKEIKYLKERAEYYQDMCEQLRKENSELRNMGKNFLDEHRNKGDM